MVRLSNLLLILLLLLLACSDEPNPTYMKSELIKLGKASDKTFKVILPKDLSSGIKCSEYGLSCSGAFTVQVQGIYMVAVEFTYAKDAQEMARVLNQYHARNWMFDDVKGEPVLIHFITKTLGATPGRPPKKSSTPK
jgi:hypothetical protein